MSVWARSEIYLNSLNLGQLKSICRAFKIQCSSRESNTYFNKPQIISKMQYFEELHHENLNREWYKYHYCIWKAWKNIRTWSTEGEKASIQGMLDSMNKNELIAYAAKLNMPHIYKQTDEELIGNIIDYLHDPIELLGPIIDHGDDKLIKAANPMVSRILKNTKDVETYRPFNSSSLVTDSTRFPYHILMWNIILMYSTGCGSTV